MKRWYVTAVALLAALVVVFFTFIFEAKIFVDTTDFYTSEPTTCKASDVDLSSIDIGHFFGLPKRLKVVSYTTNTT